MMVEQIVNHENTRIVWGSTAKTTVDASFADELKQ